MIGTHSRFALKCGTLAVVVGLVACAQKTMPRGPIAPTTEATKSTTAPAPAPPSRAGRLGSVVNGNVWSLALEDLKLSLEQAAGSGVTVVRTDDNQLKAVMPSDLGFSPHSTALGAGLKPLLDRVASGLWSNNDVQITIIGHTDNVDSDPQGVTLSLGRARAMRDYLVGKGLTTPFFQAIGRGAREPVASNDAVSGRTRNRRIEIWFREAAK
jgi:outer membrane protein OmpA-like peptidoglycan-associated protein